MKLPSLNTLLLIGVAVLLTLQLNSCFSKTHKPEEMIRNEEKLKASEERRIADSVMYAGKITILQDQITASQNVSSQLASKYQSTKVIYEKIPLVITDYDREQLRRAIYNY